MVGFVTVGEKRLTDWLTEWSCWQRLCQVSTSTGPWALFFIASQLTLPFIHQSGLVIATRNKPVILTARTVLWNSIRTSWTAETSVQPERYDHQIKIKFFVLLGACVCSLKWKGNIISARTTNMWVRLGRAAILHFRNGIFTPDCEVSYSVIVP